MSIQLIEIYDLLYSYYYSFVNLSLWFWLLFNFIWGLKDYDAAVMVGGFISHGAWCNAKCHVNLDVITKEPPKAYLVVPIVGAFLIDLIGVVVIMSSYNGLVKHQTP